MLYNNSNTNRKPDFFAGCDRIVSNGVTGYVVTMIEKIKQKKEDLILKLKKNIRKKAIKNIEQKLSYNQKKASDFSKEELRDLVNEEEKEVRKGYRNKSIGVLLTLVGLNIF